jgi:hypothetical protein
VWRLCPVTRLRSTAATPSRRRPRRQRDQRRQGRTASPFPCRAGKRRVKIFSRFAPYRKVVFNQNLARNSPAESEARQGTGREARKSSGRRLALTDRCYHNNYQIDYLSHVRKMVRNFAVASGRQVSSAPRGVERTGGAPCPRPSAITRPAAASRRCTALSRGQSGNLRVVTQIDGGTARAQISLIRSSTT